MSVSAITHKTDENIKTLDDLVERIKLLSKSLMAPFAKKQDSALDELKARVDWLIK